MTPQKYPQICHTPKIFIFLKTPKNIEIQNFEPQKMSRAYVCINACTIKIPLDDGNNYIWILPNLDSKM